MRAMPAAVRADDQTKVIPCMIAKPIVTRRVLDVELCARAIKDHDGNQPADQGEDDAESIGSNGQRTLLKTPTPQRAMVQKLKSSSCAAGEAAGEQLPCTRDYQRRPPLLPAR